MTEYRAGFALSLAFAIGAAAALAACGGNTAATPDSGSTSALPPSADQSPTVLGALPPSPEAEPPLTGDEPGVETPGTPGTPTPGGMPSPECDPVCNAIDRLGCEEDGRVPSKDECLASCSAQLKSDCGKEVVATVRCLLKSGCPGDLNDPQTQQLVQSQCPREAEAVANCFARLEGQP